MANVSGVPFVYDLNIRDVIVLKAQMSGIVDVDETWFGDPLLGLRLNGNQNVMTDLQIASHLEQVTQSLFQFMG
ncbi:MAG: hypothetical protein GY805_01280 [Chloroflexi bacterium]|nr:hypothetical protein [Chloroflexota bacterium]